MHQLVFLYHDFSNNFFTMLANSLYKTPNLQLYLPLLLNLFWLTDYMQLVECPSIYEMLPNPEFKWKKKPIIQVWRKNPEKDGIVELVQYQATDCVSLFEEALRNNEVDSIMTMFSFIILHFWCICYYIYYECKVTLVKLRIPHSIGTEIHVRDYASMHVS